MPAGLRGLITVNVVIFFVQVLLPSEWNSQFAALFGLSGNAEDQLWNPWRLITYQFLHANFLHLLFNMLWLWWMGRPVEDSLGKTRLVGIYILSGIGGALVHTAVAAFLGGNVTIGASGSVFGVMIAFAFLYPTMPIMLFLLPPIEARFVVAGLILIDLLFLGANDNSARVVHLGGALSGFLLFKSSLIYQIQDISFPSFKGVKSMSSAKSRKSMRIVEDAEIIVEVDQKKVDAILDKIAKSGYDGLSEQEKNLLYELAKKK